MVSAKRIIDGKKVFVAGPVLFDEFLFGQTLKVVKNTKNLNLYFRKTMED